MTVQPVAETVKTPSICPIRFSISSRGPRRVVLVFVLLPFSFTIFAVATKDFLTLGPCHSVVQSLHNVIRDSHSDVCILPIDENSRRYSFCRCLSVSSSIGFSPFLRAEIHSCLISPWDS